jgi:hypothetical protein
LTHPKAIRIGNRRRRPGLVWLGAIVLVPAAIGVGATGLGVLSDVKWIEHAPDWYVIRESQSAVAGDRDPALKELLRRLNGGELSDERTKDVIARQLAWQLDKNTPWAVERGDLIDAAHAAGKLSQDQWANYLANAVEFKLLARPQVRRGDDVPVRIEHWSDRCGSRTQVNLYTDTTLLPTSDLIAPKRNYLDGRNSSGSTGRGGRGSTGHTIILDKKLVADAPDGTKTVHMKMKVDLYDQPAGDGKGPPTATKMIALDTTWDLVPADAPTITPIEDASVKAAVEKSITINRIDVRANNPNSISMSLNFNNSPVPLACKIILRSGEREWDAGHIYVQKNINSGWGTGNEVKNFDAKTVDVILRPDPRTALDTIDMHEYWTGEAIIKNVPVTRSGQ